MSDDNDDLPFDTGGAILVTVALVGAPALAAWGGLDWKLGTAISLWVYGLLRAFRMVWVVQ